MATTPKVTTAFSSYADQLRELTDQPRAELQLPDDPELLSYLVSATMQVELARKQELLEMNSAASRLQRCLSLLRRESVLLEKMLTRRDAPVGPISPN
jgi:ATP-dependent Lon protease